MGGSGEPAAFICRRGERACSDIFRDRVLCGERGYQERVPLGSNAPYADPPWDTLINFPVVGTDDNAFYLSHNFSGDKDKAGCPFMDKDTQIWDFNRVIYGHNMGTGSDAMFSTLLDYEKEDYFKENQTIYFTDAYGNAAAYQVMAVVKYSIDDLEEWDFRIRNHADMESYNAWMEELQGRALYYAEPDHAPTSIITLATCDRRVFGKNGRFLVIAGR